MLLSIFYCSGLYILKSLCWCWYCNTFILGWSMHNWGQFLAFINILCLVSGFIPPEGEQLINRKKTGHTKDRPPKSRCWRFYSDLTPKLQRLASIFKLGKAHVCWESTQPAHLRPGLSVRIDPDTLSSVPRAELQLGLPHTAVVGSCHPS